IGWSVSTDEAAAIAAAIRAIRKTGSTDVDLAFRVSADTVSLLYLDASAQSVGINTSTPSGKLAVAQDNVTADIPVLSLYQADTSEEFIRFSSTIGAGSPIDTAALGTYYGKIRVHVTGVGDKFIALYNS